MKYLFMKRLYMKRLYMKRLVLSLSLFLCFQSAQALDAQLFNSYIEDIRNNKLDAVRSYLEQNKNSAETDQDYTVIYLNDFLAFSNQKLGAMGGENWLVNVSDVLAQYYPNKVYGYTNFESLYGGLIAMKKQGSIMKRRWRLIRVMRL